MNTVHPNKVLRSKNPLRSWPDIVEEMRHRQLKDAAMRSSKAHRVQVRVKRYAIMKVMEWTFAAIMFVAVITYITLTKGY